MLGFKWLCHLFQGHMHIGWGYRDDEVQWKRSFDSNQLLQKGDQGGYRCCCTSWNERWHSYCLKILASLDIAFQFGLVNSEQSLTILLVHAWLLIPWWGHLPPLSMHPSPSQGSTPFAIDGDIAHLFYLWKTPLHIIAYHKPCYSNSSYNNKIDIPVALHKENLQGCTHKKHKILWTGNNSKTRPTHDPIFTHQSFSSFFPLAIVQLFGAPHPDDQSIEHINQSLGYGGVVLMFRMTNSFHGAPRIWALEIHYNPLEKWKRGS